MGEVGSTSPEQFATLFSTPISYYGFPSVSRRPLTHQTVLEIRYQIIDRRVNTAKPSDRPTDRPTEPTTTTTLRCASIPASWLISRCDVVAVARQRCDPDMLLVQLPSSASS